LPALHDDVIYADLNTASPGLKQRLAAQAAARGVPFADVALMSPVPGNGLRTPMLASGEAAHSTAELLTTLGGVAEVLPGPAGAAASRKLLRSVFYKGMAAAVVEALRAARVAGCEEWLRENIAQELAAAGVQTVDRLERGSAIHAVRRADEMTAAADMLNELGVPPRIAAASRDWLVQLAEESPR
jgi:3-hydroxyisobutyrate dehydrogenase-like beta-hydroxyacid dehydrogenase